jgi:hypothetical protein
MSDLNLDLESHVGGDALTRVRANWRFIPHPLTFFDPSLSPLLY